MTDRPRISIPFGGAVDRDTGLLVVDRNTFVELQNWHVRSAKLLLRKGLGAFGDPFDDETEVVAVHPLRARSVGAAITYAETGGLALKVVAPDGTLLNDVGLPQSLAAGSPAPRFICADSYKYIIIAHDEPDIDVRLPTFAFDQTTGEFINFLGGGAAIGGLGSGVKFRGVARHLNYIVGWGWGTVADPDRPEYLRISLPSEPLTFDPQHYFLVGQQGEPILKCDAVNQVLGIKKLTDTYQLTGSDRPSFGVFPLDQNFGQMAARLSVSVSGINYFWSEAGPRRTGGGPSEDLALPLDLDGPRPDEMDPNDLDRGFAVYDHDNREVLFIFGAWAYVLHLDAPIPNQWSYHRFGIEITAAGFLYASTVSTGASVSNVIATLVAHISSTDRTQTWSVTIAGDLAAGDRLEFWVKEPVGVNAGAWAYHGAITIPSTAFNQEIGAGLPLMVGEASDWAVRVTNAVGTPAALYADSDPTLWPAVSRKVADAAAKTTNPDPVVDSYTVVDASPDELRITFPFDEAFHAHVTHEVEVSDGAGGWTGVTNLMDSPFEVRCDVDAFAGLTRDVRVRQNTQENVSPDSGWTTIVAVEFADTLADLVAALGTYSGIYLADRGLVFGADGLRDTWDGTIEGGVAATQLTSPTGGRAPIIHSAPARLSFDGANDLLNSILQDVGAGFTFAAIVKPGDSGPLVRTLCRVSDLSLGRPRLSFASGVVTYHSFDLSGTTDWGGQWVFVAFTQAAGIGNARLYDGATPIGDAPSSTVVFDNMPLELPGGTVGEEWFGDIFALVFSPINATDMQISDLYDALVALAATAGITVAN